MKGIVLYYSATGNTKKIAKTIHRGMKQVIEADIASLKEVNPADMANYDLIGIGSPIWFHRETANVRLLVYNMPDLTGKLGFVFTVHGITATHIFHSMVPPIQKKGLTIIGWNDWFGTYYSAIHINKPGPCDGHPDAIDFKEAEEFGREMAERARRIYAGERDLIPEIPRGPDADPLFHPYGIMRFFPGAEVPHRRINMEKCTYPGCTLCVDNCAANAIDFSADPPTFKYPCLNCALCDRLCPQGAIQIDESELNSIRADKVIDMTKCKYPDCTICVDNCMMNAIDFSVDPPDFRQSCEGDNLCWVICPEGAIEITNMETTHGLVVNREAVGEKQFTTPVLEERVANGTFRRLVPRDEVGREGPIMDIQRRPRFDINELMKDDEE